MRRRIFWQLPLRRKKEQANHDVICETDHLVNATASGYGLLYDTATIGMREGWQRRLAERGVRFIQLYHRDWDHHGNLPADLPKRCKDVDQAAAGLIRVSWLTTCRMIW